MFMSRHGTFNSSHINISVIIMYMQGVAISNTLQFLFNAQQQSEFGVCTTGAVLDIK